MPRRISTPSSTHTPPPPRDPSQPELTARPPQVPWWAGVLALLALGLAGALRPRDPPAPHLTVEDGKAGQRQWAVAVTVAVADKADVPAAAGPPRTWPATQETPVAWGQRPTAEI